MEATAAPSGNNNRRTRTSCRDEPEQRLSTNPSAQWEATMVKTGHSKRKLFTNAKEQKENTTPQDHLKQVTYSSIGSSAPHPSDHHHHHYPDLHEGSGTNVPLKYSCTKIGSVAAAGQRPLPNIAGTAVASPGPGNHSSSAPSPHPYHDGRGGLACPSVTASPRLHTMPMSERQQIALLLQMSSPSPPSKGVSNSCNSQGSVSSRCNSPYSPHCSGGGQDYPSSGPLYGGTAQLAQQHYSGMVTGSGGRGGGVAKRNERGETPLHVAAIRGDADRVHHLIARGSDVNAVDYAGWTALHEACNRGFVSVARELISAGAFVNAKGLDNETPLHDACVNNHFKIVELLLESGASTTVLNRRGQTPGEVCRSPVILSLLRRAKQHSGDGSCDDRSSESPSKMSRRTPPNNKLECAKMDVKPSDNVKSEKDIKTEDADDGSLTSVPGSSLPSAGGSSSGGAQGGTASGPCSGSGGTPGSSSSPGSPRVTLRLPSSTTRTPEKAVRSASDAKGGEAGSDDPYEFKCSKDDPSHGAAGSTAPGGGTDIPSKGADGAAGEERGEKRSAAEEDDEGEQAKKKKKKEDAGKEAGASGGTAQGGKGVNRGGRAAGEKSSKPAARSGPLHGAANPSFSTGVSKIGTGSGTSSSGFQGSSSATPTSSANSSVSSSSLPGSTSSNNSSSNASSTGGGGSSGNNSDVNRKSPLISASSSPKTSIKQEKCEDGSDDEGSRPDTTLSTGGGGGGGGPKVPPLKIVLSSCGGGSSNTGGTSSQEQEQSGPQTGKNASARHLPYVVPANQVDQSVKEEVASPPSDCKDTAHGDEPLSPGGSTGGEKSATRITRSQRGTGSNSADESSGTVKVEVKQEDHLAVTTTSSGSSGNSTTSASSNGSSGSSSSSSSTTAVTASATTTTTTSSSSSGSGGSGSNESVHPRKRKLNIKEEEPEPAPPPAPEQPLSNCYQMFMKIRKQIDDRRKLLFPVQPKPPQGFKDYLMNRGTYVLAGNLSSQQSVPIMDPPTTLSQPLKDLFTEQERDRYKLRLQHQIEREKLVLSVEQEILREHGRAARALANQALPFSACTVLRDQEVYNILTPEQEEKHRNARSRYNGRLFLSWLQDVDDKWEKIKESMVLRQQNEAESLNAVHRMDWEWKMKELGLCDNKSRPVIEDLHVPTVAVSDFDLLPA